MEGKMIARKRLMRGIPYVLIVFSMGCQDGGKLAPEVSSDTHSADIDTGTGTEDPTDEPSSNSDSGSDEPVDPWEGVSFERVHAPTRESVAVVFRQAPGEALARELSSYSLRLGQDIAAIESLTYDPTTRTATLQTEKQTLGLSYMLEILHEGEPVPGLTAAFPTADTAAFWVVDWTRPGTAQQEIVAHRAAVGKKCVLYVEHGQPSSGAQAAAQAFDNQIYDVETQTFTQAPDQDGNGRITLLWLDGRGVFGGYFDPTNTYPDHLVQAWWGLHSNEMELLHFDATTMQAGLEWFVDIAAHEFQHLLYNKRHGNQAEYWTYHDEGLAEMAVHLVKGENDYATNFFFDDANGLIGGGLSLVNWTYALYENYALAYLFWAYAAGQLGGIEAIGEFFHLDSGSPGEVNTYLESRLGAGLPEIHRRSLIAAWAQQTSGPYGFGGLVDLGGRVPPTVLAGTTSVDLQPFSGAFFPFVQGEIDYPGTQGDNIVYAGIDGMGQVDLEAPFSLVGGALLAYNRNLEYALYEAERSGPDIAAAARSLPRRWSRGAGISAAWNNPPPVTPDHRHLLEAWRDRVFALRNETVR
jgi:hypothetical protein